MSRTFLCGYCWLNVEVDSRRAARCPVLSGREQCIPCEPPSSTIWTRAGVQIARDYLAMNAQLQAEGAETWPDVTELEQYTMARGIAELSWSAFCIQWPALAMAALVVGRE